MPSYDYDSVVSVDGPTLTTFRTALTTAAAALPAASPWKDAFTKLANVALPVNNRFLGEVYVVYMWAANHKNDSLRDAAQAVRAAAAGFP